jgi:hypothetical protein
MSICVDRLPDRPLSQPFRAIRSILTAMSLLREPLGKGSATSEAVIAWDELTPRIFPMPIGG